MFEKEIKFNLYLGGENVSIGGQVEYFKCKSCDSELFDLGLCSETDMNYMGVIGLVDLSNKRLLITRLTPKEWNNYSNYVPTLLEKRINKIFNTNNFKKLVYKEYVDPKTDERLNARDCLKCTDLCLKTGYDKFEDFVKKGGQILAMDGDYEISNW